LETYQAAKLGSSVEPCSPFGGIPRNWKHVKRDGNVSDSRRIVPPSGGSLEIGNVGLAHIREYKPFPVGVPPSGGSLEIGNEEVCWCLGFLDGNVPPSGGSLEIGNGYVFLLNSLENLVFPLRGDP